MCIAVTTTTVTATDIPLGEELERRCWQLMHDNNWEEIERFISPAFQSIHEDGARSGLQEIELIRGLDLGHYHLNDFNCTQSDDVIVVSYFVMVPETIDGQQLPGKKSARMSVWHRMGDRWYWLSHSNLANLDNSTMDKADQKINDGVEETSSSIERGFDKTGDSLDRTMDKMGRAINKAVHKTGEALKKTGDKIQNASE
jgi:hypothetical protein